MSETLETIVDKYIESQSDIVFRENVVPEDREAYVSAIKKELTNRIYCEIQNEVQDNALANAEEIIEQKAGLKRIEEFKKLTINGLIVAFFVGLLVNQSTDIIGYFKGSFQTQNIWTTVIISVGILLICIGIFAGLFIFELLKMLKNENYKKR